MCWFVWSADVWLVQRPMTKVVSVCRGYKLCKRKFLNDPSRRDLQLSRCAYIDNTMFDCEPASPATMHSSSHQQQGGAEAHDPQWPHADAVNSQQRTMEHTDHADTSPLSPIASERTANSAEEGSVEDKASGAVTPVVTPVMTYQTGQPPSPNLPRLTRNSLPPLERRDRSDSSCSCDSTHTPLPEPEVVSRHRERFRQKRPTGAQFTTGY